MCFKKEENPQDKLSKILAGRMSIVELNFNNVEERKIAEECLKLKPSLISLLSEVDKYQLSVMVNTVRKNYSAILFITDRVPCNELLEAYLVGRREASKQSAQNADFKMVKSFSKNLLFSLNYQTCEGEEIGYFDKKLKIPNKLKVSATLTFKLVDACRLFSFIDLDIKYVDSGVIESLLTKLTTYAFRSEISAIMENDPVGFYALSSKYELIVEKVTNKLAPICAKAGMQISEINLKTVDMPDNTCELLEKEFFALARAERKQVKDLKINELSLVNYEKKAEIQHKYPEFEETLTEIEKDKALERYLLKMGRTLPTGEQRSKEKLGKRAGKVAAEGFKVTDTVIKAKPSMLKAAYIGISMLLIFASLMVFIGFAMRGFIGSAMGGFIALGVSCLIITLAGVILYPKLKKTKKVEDKNTDKVAAAIESATSDSSNESADQ